MTCPKCGNTWIENTGQIVKIADMMKGKKTYPHEYRCPRCGTEWDLRTFPHDYRCPKCGTEWDLK